MVKNMAEDTLMETDGGDNITREQVSFILVVIVVVVVVMIPRMVVVIFKFLGVGPDEREGGFGS